MMKNNCKRFLSVLLAVCMMFSSIGAHSVYAVGVDGCTCGTENETHASDCALMLENQEICTCTPVDGIHQEGCTFYVPPAIASEPAPISDEVCTCTPVDGVHQEGCTFYVAPTCTCTPVGGVHQEGCALYVAPTCSCTPVEGVHQEGCALYVAPTCSCTPVEGVHQEGCALYVAPTCSCTPVEGVHQEGCAQYVAPTCSCTPVEGVHQEGCAFYVAPTCTCTPVEGVHQEGCNFYVIPVDETENEVSLSAGIYMDANRTQLASELTSEGATLSGWNFLSGSMSVEDRYLGVSLSGLSMDSTKQYRLVVSMAPILYINQNDEPTLTNTTVSYVRNAPISVNDDGQYEPAVFSLSNLTYLIDSGTEALTFGLPLRFDINLWNKQDGAKLGDGSKPLLRIHLQEKQTDGSFVTIDGQDVSLLQATVSGKLGYSLGFRTYIVGGSEVETSNMGADDTMRAHFSQFTNAYNGGHYVSDLKIEIKIPSCTVGETTHRLQYKDFSINGVSGTPKFEESFDENTGILTITAQNIYTESSLFTIYFMAPDAVKDVPGSYIFTGNVSVTADGIKVASNLSKTITVDTDSKAILNTYKATGLANVLDLETVQVLGNLAINNTAAAQNGSGPLWISLHFDTNDTNAIAVSTVNIMCDRDTENITIRYSLVNKDGSPAFVDPQTGINQVFTTTVANKRYSPGGTVSNSSYQTFTRNDLPGDHSQYYFETFTYTMGNLPGNGFPYNPSANRSPSGGGTFWGYITTGTIPSVMPTHSMTIYRQNTDGEIGEELLATTTTTTIDDGTKSVYGIKSAITTATVVPAGDSVTIKGTVYIPNYPYSSNNCLNNIRLGIVLPAGVTVNAASVTATYKVGSLSVEEIEQRPLDNGETLYIIKFESGQKIGYYNEYLKAIESGDSLTFSVQLNTDKSISSQPFIFRERIFVAGLGQINSASGSYSDNSVLDVYDLNGNGRTDDTVGCFGDTTTTSISFQASPAELTITDELTDKDGNSGTSLTMETFADILNYNLHIECTEGGSASEFYYMIPIAKEGIDADPLFVERRQVDLELKGAAVVTTSQGTAMKVLYSTTPITGYSGTLSINDWTETLPEGKTWSDVTVIKVVAGDTTIENGSINVISVPLGLPKDVDTEYEHMAGYQIQWSSRGYYHYKVGYNSNSGTRSTAGCTITLTYTRQEPVSFTLTAAKGGDPVSGSKTYVLDLEVLFYLAQEYRVKQITPYNVNLMDSDYNFDNATSAEANENFRINISVKKKDEDTSQNPIALQKDNDIIGKLDENSIPVFTFTIENADALSDIVTDRKVTLTLIGSNGVIVPVEITIKRELAAAEPTQSAIVAGELYAPFEGSTSTTVSCDSAFTAQFVTEYIPKNYTGHTIEFGSAPASGTTITMIDWTDPTALKFYNYTMNGSTKTVNLTAFQGMGSSGAFTESTNADVVMERLLFIVSFPADSETIRDNTMKLTKDLVEGTTTDEEPSVLTFTTVSERVFSLATSASSVKYGNDFTVSYTSGCSVTDSRYTGRNLSLVIEPSSGTSFPADAYLVVDGTNYYLNAQGNFIVPLRGVQTGNGSVTVSFYSQTIEQASFQISLWASATASGAKPLMGDRVAGPVSVSVSAKTAPSFEVVSMSDRLLEINDLSSPVIVSFKKEHTETVTIELQKKIGEGYVTQTTILESVNGNTMASQGVFTVNGTSATIKLSGSTTVGTYRLLFTVSNEYETIEIPYNFVVVD